MDRHAELALSRIPGESLKHLPRRDLGGGVLRRHRAAAERAAGKGLHVNAGHGLNYRNVGPVAAMAHVRELNIGHAIIARSVFVGIAQAVREMKALLG